LNDAAREIRRSKLAELIGETASHDATGGIFFFGLLPHFSRLLFELLVQGDDLLVVQICKTIHFPAPWLLRA